MDCPECNKHIKQIGISWWCIGCNQEYEIDIKNNNYFVKTIGKIESFALREVLANYVHHLSKEISKETDIWKNLPFNYVDNNNNQIIATKKRSDEILGILSTYVKEVLKNEIRKSRKIS